MRVRNCGGDLFVSWIIGTDLAIFYEMYYIAKGFFIFAIIFKNFIISIIIAKKLTTFIY